MPKPIKTFRCPHCREKVSLKVIAKHLGTLGGAKGGASTSEAKQKAARINLEKARAAKEKK